MKINIMKININNYKNNISYYKIVRIIFLLINNNNYKFYNNKKS